MIPKRLKAAAALCVALIAAACQAADKKPNILFIMGDDGGWFNIGAYHQGVLAGRPANLDQLAAEGMRFTGYCAEASCTANFITGQLPIRTGRPGGFSNRYARGSADDRDVTFTRNENFNHWHQPCH